MQASEIQQHAQKLYAAHGDRAEAEAAAKARELDGAGKAEEAETWRKIRQAIMAMRGPHAS